MAEKYKGTKPILLLDDIFDKLDDFRIAKLLALIKSELGQLFITDARPDRTKSLLGPNSR
jgi:DNA replication and repair protein RecF